MSGTDVRQSLASALVAGAVVIVVGWASGFGNLVTGAVAGPAPAGVSGLPSALPTGSGPTAPPVDGDNTSAASAALATSTGIAATPGHDLGARPSPAHLGATRTTVSPTLETSTPPTSSASTPTSVPVGARTCTPLVDAVVQPFVTHLDAVHPQESPSQQVADLLNISQYVKTHTALIEAMVRPLYALLPAVARSIDAFVQHVYHGHLEESPSQQVADILDTDRYVKTHTVLIETMAAPLEQTADGC